MNEIVDELAKDERIKTAYDLWYEMREEVLRTYGDKLPERVPLSQQKELKRIKNAVIEEAVRLGEQEVKHRQEGSAHQESQQEPGVEATAFESENRTESNNAGGQKTLPARDHKNDPWIPRQVQCVTKLLRHMGRIFEENPPPKPRGAKFTDRKLLQKIREKKIAHGHKPDDHEAQKMV